MPKQLVSDPEFKTPGSPELDRIVDITREEKGDEGVEEMTKVIAELFQSYSMHIQSFYKAIVN